MSTTRVLAAVSLVGSIWFSVSAQQPPQREARCEVSTPNGVVAGSSERQERSYGNSGLSVFGLWPDGTVIFRPGGAGFVTRDGALGMKFGWTRGVPGKLKVTGHRLDGLAPPLRFSASDRYRSIGFQPSYLIFPTPGCWEVIAQIDEREDSSLTFVTKIVKIGEGPAWRLDPPIN